MITRPDRPDFRCCLFSYGRVAPDMIPTKFMGIKKGLTKTQAIWRTAIRNYMNKRNQITVEHSFDE